MTTACKPFALCCLLLSLACDTAERDEPGPSPSPLGPTAPSEPTDPDARAAACEQHTRDYSDRMTECFAAEEVSDDDVERVCDLSLTSQSVWYDCVQEVERFTACGDEVGCEGWFGVECWSPYRAMMVCFGEPDPGAEPPQCPYANDAECDEPEGTGLCLDGTDVADCEGGGGGGDTGGEAPSCDPSACSGCVTDCDDFGCYQCCWSCNGSSCEQSCNF